MLIFVLVAQLVSAAPPMTPDQAIAVLQASHSDRDRTNAPPDVRSYPGPRAVVIGTGDATLGPWTFPRRAPARRLDGTRLSDPVTVYGLPWSPYGGGPGRRVTPTRGRRGPR